jgi:hypothetical protein
MQRPVRVNKIWMQIQKHSANIRDRIEKGRLLENRANYRSNSAALDATNCARYSAWEAARGA